MRYYKFFFALFLLISVLGLALLPLGGVAVARAQQPTVDVPTVTGTALGPYVVVNGDQIEGINVRTGPGTDYPAVGILIPGEIAAAKGRSVAGLWIQVAYAPVDGGLAWVYSPLVTLFDAASLPIIEPPSTPTPRVTPTIDPTLAAQFVLEIPATRLPTFTPVEPLEIPQYQQAATGRVGGIPVGMLITAVGLVGLFGTVVAYLRDR